MNKSDLVKMIADKTDLTSADASAALEATLSSIAEALKGGDTCTLIGFGTFVVRDRAEREGRNPRTGETIIIPAAKVPAFKPGKGLKEAVNPPA